MLARRPYAYAMTTTQHRAIATLALAGGIALTGVGGGGYSAHATTAGKVTLCHYANGNPHTITVAAPAAAKHLGHAGTGVPGHEKDTLGACPTTTPTPSPTAPAETPEPTETPKPTETTTPATPEPSPTSTPTAPAGPVETSPEPTQPAVEPTPTTAPSDPAPTSPPSPTQPAEPASPASPEPSETATPVTPDPTTQPAQPREQDVCWTLAPGSTPTAAGAFTGGPQTLTNCASLPAPVCGTTQYVQHDTYRIKPEDEAAFAALLAGGTLASPAADALFEQGKWTFIEVAPKPASECNTAPTPTPTVDPCRYGAGRHHPSCPALPPAPGRPTHPHTGPVIPSTPAQPSTPVKPSRPSIPGRPSVPAPLPAADRPETAPHTVTPGARTPERGGDTTKPSTAPAAGNGSTPAAQPTSGSDKTAPVFDAGTDGELAYTGLNGQAVRDLGILAAALILGGAALTIASRRRRS